MAANWQQVNPAFPDYQVNAEGKIYNIKTGLPVHSEFVNGELQYRLENDLGGAAYVPVSEAKNLFEVGAQ